MFLFWKVCCWCIGFCFVDCTIALQFFFCLLETDGSYLFSETHKASTEYNKDCPRMIILPQSAAALSSCEWFAGKHLEWQKQPFLMSLLWMCRWFIHCIQDFHRQISCCFVCLGPATLSHFRIASLLTFFSLFLGGNL